MAVAEAMKANGNTQDLLRPMSRTGTCYFCLNLLAKERRMAEPKFKQWENILLSVSERNCKVVSLKVGQHV